MGGGLKDLLVDSNVYAESTQKNTVGWKTVLQSCQGHHHCIWMSYSTLVTCSSILTGIIRAPSSEFVSSSIPSLQILTAHAQPFRWARDLAFCLKVPLDSLLVWASSGGSGETARMRRLAWTFAARIGDKYQNRLARSIRSYQGTGLRWTYMYLKPSGNSSAPNTKLYRQLMLWLKEHLKML